MGLVFLPPSDLLNLHQISDQTFQFWITIVYDKITLLLKILIKADFGLVGIFGILV